MPSFNFENDLSKDDKKIIGIDEVGCGPWAGPLVACACYIDPKTFPAELLKMINDSKKMTAKNREKFVDSIQEEINRNIFYGIGCIEIEEFNVLGLKNALLKAIKSAVLNINIKVDHLLIDGIRNPNLDYPTTMIVKGDQRSYTIAAASIIAKVYRDRLMQQLHLKFPEYRWDKNAGYGTKDHIDAIQKFGLTPHHRFCYKPIQKYLENSILPSV
jgi:ribonuclease HII